MDEIDCDGKPCSIDLRGLDSRVGNRFPVRFKEQLFGVRVPAFAKSRAAHANDCDLVSNASWHGPFSCPQRPAGPSGCATHNMGVAFQKYFGKCRRLSVSFMRNIMRTGRPTAIESGSTSANSANMRPPPSNSIIP